ncbi:MAG: CbiX/SirB N-terminal domain-containing protein [Planctomycetia bacterium]
MSPRSASRRLPIVRGDDGGVEARTDVATGLGPGCGVVIVGHGTADPVGAAETHAVGKLVADMLPGVPVEVGFLEVIGPAIGDALAALAARGCRRVVAAPLILFTAGHAKRDIPEALDAGGRAAGLVVHQAAAMGCHPSIVALARRRRREAVRGLEPVPAAAMGLVMIGRGSSDPRAVSQLLEFTAATFAPGASACPHDLEACRIGLGFVAAARPSLVDGLDAAAAGPDVRRVVVQPHLLFRGHVEEQAAAAVARARDRHPAVEWIVTARLGAEPDVAEALVDRIAEALPSP